MNRKDYEAAMRMRMGELKGNQDHSHKELEMLCKTIPIGVMKDGRSLAGWCADNAMSLIDSAIILSWVYSQMRFLMDISGNAAYDKAVEYYEQAQSHTIVLHRVNYILHDCMIKVYDILERDGKLRFAVKKAVSDAEKPWNDFLSDRRRRIEKSAYYTFQDHLRLACDAVSPCLEKVYESVRDYIISLGYKDVEVKARCVIVFLMAKVAGHSFKAFFRDYEKECGIDFSGCFGEDDMSGMVRLFSVVCERLGVSVEKDKDGYYGLKGLDIEKSIRFNWAWKAFIDAMRDDDLMDEKAKEAIALNPEIEKDYHEALEEEERKMIGLGLEQLSGKFKIGKL